MRAASTGSAMMRSAAEPIDYLLSLAAKDLLARTPDAVARCRTRVLSGTGSSPARDQDIRDPDRRGNHRTQAESDIDRDENLPEHRAPRVRAQFIGRERGRGEGGSERA